MRPKRKISRRSFLASVAGGAAIGGGALSLLAPAAAQTGVTDRDPGDRVGYGRGGGTGMTDSDSGVGADPAGRGRGGGPRPGATGVTDSDPTDAVGRGRGGSGITDTDSGPYADQRGRGRGGQRGPSESSPYDPAARDLRCENNRRLYAELSRDGPTAGTWSEGQLSAAEADLAAVRFAARTQVQTTVSEQEINRAWDIISAAGRRYNIATSRHGNWFAVENELQYLVTLAQNSPARAERLRQLEQVRSNLVALGC